MKHVNQAKGKSYRSNITCRAITNMHFRQLLPCTSTTKPQS